MINERLKIGLLIATYNWPKALHLVLNSILKQSRLPDEILIGDDGSKTETWNIIEQFSKYVNIPIIYEWQEDHGFRKSIVLNKVMKKSTADYIIQIDGDIIMHPNFIEDHIRHAQVFTFVQGCRTLISDTKTQSLLAGERVNINWYNAGIQNRLNAFRFPTLSFLFQSTSNTYKNIKACNIAYWRQDFIEVNGYDNSFNGWGWEDDEFAARLIHKGIMKKRLKLSAVCYHLDHPIHSRYHVHKNEGIYFQTVQLRRIMAENGLAQV